ncbi:MAG TPA: M1 family aminopeptidase [Thermoanaerobaculia bacterium]
MRKLAGHSLRGWLPIVCLTLLRLPAASWGTEPLVAPLPEYGLKIRLSPPEGAMEVEGTVRLGATEAARTEVRLALGELVRQPRFEIASPAEAAGPVELESRSRPWERPGWGTVVWSLRPRAPLPAGKDVVVRFSYAIPAGSSSFGFNLDAEAAFGMGLLTAWYPEVEDNPTVRLRGLRGTGKLEFSVPPGVVVHATGGPGLGNGESAKGRFEFDVRTPASFSFAAGRYAVTRREEPFPIRVYSLRPRPHLTEHIEGSARIIEVLSAEFGEYPYRDFALVEVPDGAAREAGFSGANADGFVLTTGSFLDQRFNTAYYGHEIAHQWWGGLVQRSGPAGGYMLDEAMAQYASLRAVEEIEGPEAAERYRRTGYPGFTPNAPDEYSGLGYLRRAAVGFDHRLADLPLDDDLLSRRMANSKGMLVWDLLGRTIGRERFRQALTKATRKHAFQRITWQEFLAFVESESGQDLGWFYDQWLQRTGVPKWRLDWSARGRSLHVRVEQEGDPYRATVELRVLGTAGECAVQTLELRERVHEADFAVPFAVKDLALDPRFLVPHRDEELAGQALALAPFTQGQLMLLRAEYGKAEAHFLGALERVPLPDPHGLRFLLESGLAEALLEQDKAAAARGHLDRALAAPTRGAADLPYAYYLLARVAKKQGDRAALAFAVDAVLSAEAILGRPTGLYEQAKALLSP